MVQGWTYEETSFTHSHQTVPRVGDILMPEWKANVYIVIPSHLFVFLYKSIEITDEANQDFPGDISEIFLLYDYDAVDYKILKAIDIFISMNIINFENMN